jgi:hypothetical protein
VTRILSFSLFYLLIAIAVQFGVLSVLGDGFFAWGDARPLALGVVLLAILRDRWTAIGFAMVAALAQGSAGGTGELGASWLSFFILAMISSGMPRWFYLDRFAIRFFVFFGLLSFEVLIYCFVRHLFWRELPIEFSWPIHALVALAGAVLYVPALRRLLHHDRVAEPIGRRQTR